MHGLRVFGLWVDFCGVGDVLSGQIETPTKGQMVSGLVSILGSGTVALAFERVNLLHNFLRNPPIPLYQKQHMQQSR